MRTSETSNDMRETFITRNKIISDLIGQVGPILLGAVTCLWTDWKRWKCKRSLLLIGFPVKVGEFCKFTPI